MKIFDVKGKECAFFLEEGNQDGGLVLGCLVPTGSGTYRAYRHWYQDPAKVRGIYADLESLPEEVASRVARAEELGVTGKLVRS